MPLNSSERFSNRVENYVKYRPGYPEEMLGLFRDEMNLSEHTVVADIGSGTGISARLFLENGNRVFGVEPNEPMRCAAEDFLHDYQNFISIDGTAENTNLADAGVDLIVAAQAFHWFKFEHAALEFKRILKAGGYIALIWNERRLDSTPFLREYEDFLLKFAIDYLEVRHEQVTRKTLESAFQTEFRRAVFENAQMMDFEGLKGRMLSSSYMPSPEHPTFEDMIKNLKTLFAEHQKNGRIQVSYDTRIFYTQY